MLFTSYTFFAFAAGLTVLYYLLPGRVQWVLLLLGSWFFYCCAGPRYLPYLLFSCFSTWYAAVRIDQNFARQRDYLKEHKAELDKEGKRAYKEGQKKLRLRWLVLCLLLNLGVLAVVKYSNFFITNVNGVLSVLGQGKRLSFLSLALPMGISFYTFQAVGYLIDVYRGAVPAQRNPFRYALFVSFFPQLIQGPISRYGDLSPSLYAPHPFRMEALCLGLERMLWGYFKKLVIADRILAAVRTIVGSPAQYQGGFVLAGMLFYTIQLYADFTGGIDITIGFAQVLGIEVRENFMRPYFSTSLKEYWRRWHISMCSWFRDYVFYPVSVSRPVTRFAKFTRKRFGNTVGRRLPVYLSTFVVWLATGVWHGASWNFIAWGLANWGVLMVSEELEPLYARFHTRFPAHRGWRIFQMLRTFVLVCCLNLFDCYRSVGETFGAFASLFTVRNYGVLTDGSLLELGLSALDYGILAFGCAVLLLVSVVQRRGSVRGYIAALPAPARFLLWYALFLLVLLLGAYGIGYDASQFIYNQF